MGAGGLSDLPDAKLDEMALRIAGAAFRFNVSAKCIPNIDPTARDSCCN